MARNFKKEWLNKEFQPELVSVVIPTYNRASVLPKALSSVYEQTYRPIEIIVADDGSRDETEKVVQKWRHSFTNSKTFFLKYFFQQNQGAPAARNLGLRECSGQYIQLLDSDDLLQREKIKNQVTVLKKLDKNTAVYGDLCEVEEIKNGFKISKVYSRNASLMNREELLRNYLRPWPKNPHVYLWRRDTINSIGPWDETLANFDDYEYGWRFLMAGGKLEYVPNTWAIFCSYGNDTGRVSKSDSKDAWNSRIRVFQKIESSLKKNKILPKFKKELANMYYFLRKSARESGEENIAVFCRKQALKFYGNGASMYRHILKRFVIDTVKRVLPAGWHSVFSRRKTVKNIQHCSVKKINDYLSV